MTSLTTTQSNVLKTVTTEWTDADPKNLETLLELESSRLGGLVLVAAKDDYEPFDKVVKLR